MTRQGARVKRRGLIERIDDAAGTGGRDLSAGARLILGERAVQKKLLPNADEVLIAELDELTFADV